MLLRTLALAALASLILAAVPASAGSVASPDASPHAEVQEECGGMVAVGCTHETADGFCVLYVSPQCVLWITP